MQITRFHSAAEFYPQAESYLLEREAQHNLILGVCGNHIRHPETIRNQPYFAIVEDAGQIVSTAMVIPPFDLVLTHTATNDALPLIAEDVQAAGFPFPAVQSTKDTSKAFADHWLSKTGKSYRNSMAMRIYQLTAVTPVTGVPGRMRPAESADRPILAGWLDGFHVDTHLPGPGPDVEWLLDAYLNPETSDIRGYVVWEVDGQIVSLSAYVGPTPNGIRVNTVYTPPEHRRKGYASALVADLSQMLLDSGRKFCFLFTDLKNPTSNKIYQEIGYRPVCDIDEYWFED